MSLYDSQRHRVYGLVLGIVSNNEDPDTMGRVKVKYHMLNQEVESDWCRVISIYAGTSRGSFFIPEVDDEVVLGFEYGDVNFPFVIGSVYNGVDKPPAGQDENKKNNLKRIRSRSGHEFTFDDTDGEEKITLVDCKEKRSIVIDVSGKKITIEALDGDMDILVPEGTLTIKCKDLKVESSATTSMVSKSTFSVKSTKDYTVKTDANAKLEAAQGIKVESKGASIEMKASVAFKAQATQTEIKASAMGKMEAGGPLTIKGAVVNIN